MTGPNLDYEPGRPETGPMQFSGDWTGTFIRGDDSFVYACSLKVLMDPNADELSLMLAKMMLEGLLKCLSSSDERCKDTSIQRMREFINCSR